MAIQKTKPVTKRKIPKGKNFSFDSAKGELSHKQRLFCMEYARLKFNGKQAAINAGYSPHTAEVQASRLLTKAKVKELVAELKNDIGAMLEISAVDIARQYKNIGFFNIKNILTVDGGLKSVIEMSDEDAAAIASLESYDEKEPDSGMVLGTVRKIKITDKIQALDKLARMIGVDGVTKVANTNSSGKDLPPAPQLILPKGMEVNLPSNTE